MTRSSGAYRRTLMAGAAAAAAAMRQRIIITARLRRCRIRTWGMMMLILQLFANHHYRGGSCGVAWGLSSSSSTRPGDIARSTAAAAPISVAIIGGGVAGLSCAERLCQGGNNNDDNGSTPLFDVTVFDTGRLRPGGRCSSRQAGDPPKDKQQDSSNLNPILSRYRYDHAAQIVTVPSPPASSSSNNNSNPLVYADFAQQVQQWETDGILTPFPPQSVYHICSHQKMDPIENSSSSSSRMYYGTHGMGSIPQAMVQQNNSQGGADFGSDKTCGSHPPTA